jgi:hypothetical protein
VDTTTNEIPPPTEIEDIFGPKKSKMKIVGRNLRGNDHFGKDLS